MTYRWTRRIVRSVLSWALALGVVFGTATLAESAPTRWQAEHSRYANHLACPQQWWTGTTATRALVICEARLFGVDVSRSLCVANRESGFHAGEYLASSSASGVFQFLARLWSRWFGQRFARGGWHLSLFSGRTNTVGFMNVVREQGINRALGYRGPWYSARHPC